MTSNDLILDVRGDEHPLPMYLDAEVPVTLATDDEGVSRIDLTNEYLRAALTYDSSYRELETMARNSLEYSFLPGASRSRSRAEFLASSERAQAQWRLEAEFVTFETLDWMR